MPEPIPERAEPLGCTLADLIALTLGAAIAASLNWYSGSFGGYMIGGKVPPSWYISASHFIELFQKGCVALIPVILYRSWRYGRPIRPVEYFPILQGLSQVAFSTSKWPIFGIYYPSPDPPHTIHVNMEAETAWEQAQIAIGLVAVVLFALRRRRSIDWLAGFLLAVAWDRLTEMGGYVYQQWANNRIWSLRASTMTTILLSNVLVQGPQQLVGWMPLAVMLVEWTWSPRRRRSWVEWAAFSLAVPLPAFYEWRSQAHRFIERDLLSAGNAIHLSGKMIAFGLSYALARWSEPAWRLLLGASPTNPPGNHEENPSYAGQ